MTTPTPPPARALPRLAEIREDISSRLRAIADGMSSPVYNSLLDQMAMLQYKFEQASATNRDWR